MSHRNLSLYLFENVFPKEAHGAPEQQPGSSVQAFKALKIHSATAELAPLRFQWINFIKNFSEGNHSDTSGEATQLYHMFSCLTYTDYLGLDCSGRRFSN